MLQTTVQAASTESTQVSSPFVNLIVFTAQCGQLLQLLYMRIIIPLVRNSRKRVFMGNNVFLHKFYTTRQDPKFHCNTHLKDSKIWHLYCLKRGY